MGISNSFIIPLLLLTFPLIFASENSDLIKKTCKTTKYYDLCVSSLKSDPTSPKADTKGLATIMVGIGISNATSTYTYLSSQLLSTSNDTSMKKVLKECADKYSYANDSLQATIQDLGMENYDYAYTHVTAAQDYPNSCHNAFRRNSGLIYPVELAKREDGLKRICDVVLGILDLLGW
ncbi:Pectinesterase inhibitor domain [Dillenia turbinata]|uniref:Pectinesterase inhibitor domain n=1 Tax=Dillenia turbinata TaxID=194707 RepID=A0AAN8UYH3_9MAGN